MSLPPQSGRRPAVKDVRFAVTGISVPSARITVAGRLYVAMIGRIRAGSNRLGGVGGLAGAVVF